MLANAVNSGVELFILGPGSAENFAADIKDEKRCFRGADLWNGLAGYFPFNLISLFPPDGRVTEELRMVSTQFFGQLL